MNYDELFRLACDNRDRAVALWDFDSTLRDSAQRHHLSPANCPGSTWDDYSAAGIDDEPMHGPIMTLRLFHAMGLRNHIISGSNESAHALSLEWLSLHVGLQHIESVRLRAAGDHRENGAYKAAYVEEVRARSLIPVVFFEDWPPAAEHIQRETGVPVVVVNPCYPCKNCGLTAEQIARIGQTDNVGGGL
jgi:hypothetical protein